MSLVSSFAHRTARPRRAIDFGCRSACSPTRRRRRSTIVPAPPPSSVDGVGRQIVERAAPHLLLRPRTRRRRSPPACRATSRARSAGRRSPRDAPSPISTTSVTPFGCELRRSPTANASSSWPRHDEERRRDAAMRDRNAGRAPARRSRCVTPGTTSNGTPARCSASASSPPRPNTNGSPPFSRTTRRPRRAARIISAWIVGLRHRVTAGALADEEALRAPREPQDALVDERVVEHEIGARAAARSPSASAARDRRARRRRARRVPSQPRVLRCVQPRHRARLPPIAELRQRARRLACSALRRARSAPRAAAAARSSIGTPSRRQRDALGARLATSTSPDPRGSTRVERLAQQRRQRRRVAARSKSRASRRRAGRRRSETRVALAGSSTAFTKTRRASAASATARFDLGRRRRDDQPRAVEIGRRERRAARSCDVRLRCDRRRDDLGRDDADVARRRRAAAAASRRRHGPPPTSRTRRPARLRNSGKKSGIAATKQKRPGKR